MMRTLAVANQKGGVGKTTTVVNVAAGMVKFGQRTLLIDLDPQANATTGSGVDKSRITNSIYNLLLGESTFSATVQHSSSGGYSLLPANRELAGAEVELVQSSEREFRLRKLLQPLERQFDVVLIDCPPALNLLTINGLAAARRVLIPMQCEYYALEGLSDLVQTIRRVRQHLNPELEIEGLIRTMMDPRNALAQQVSSQLERHFGGKVYRSIVPRNVRLAEAPSYGQPGVVYDPAAKGSVAYLNLTREILQRFSEENSST